MESPTTTPTTRRAIPPADSILPQAGTANLKDPYIAKIPKEWIGIRMAHEAAMVQDAVMTLQADREQRRQVQDKLLGTQTPRETSDDMAMHIGDVINYTSNQPAQTSQPQPSQFQPSAQSALASGLSNLAKAGIAAAILGSGGIGALGAHLLSSAPSAAPAVAPIVQQVQAADPGVQLRIYQPPQESSANGAAND